jgi:hypothetical protein
MQLVTPDGYEIDYLILNLYNVKEQEK